MRVDIYASQPHYLRHIAPVWWELDPDERGVVHVPTELREIASQLVGVGGERGNVRLGAGWSDVQGPPNDQKRVLMEHGIGQSYIGCRRPNYVNGHGRENIDLVLLPNDASKQGHTGGREVAIIGSPYLDTLTDDHPGHLRIFDAAVSFHFDAVEVAPEATSGFWHFRSAVAKARDDNTAKIIGHGHPRMRDKLEPWYTDHHVGSVWDFQAAINLSTTYACDNSSTMFYAAALDVPVIVLNPPAYRTYMRHGLRFWELAHVGEQVSDPSELVPAIERAVADPGAYATNREEVSSILFPHRGQAAKRAAEAIRATFN